MWSRNIHMYGSFLPFGTRGPMQNLLGPLTSRCPNLRSLTMRKVGQTHPGEFTPPCIAKDKDIYREFATFIDSVRPTLQQLVFEQGERTARHVVPPPGQNLISRSVRPMDSRSLLICSFLLVPWQNLEKFELGGVTTTMRDGEHSVRISSRSPVKLLNREFVQLMDHFGLGDPRQGRR